MTATEAASPRDASPAGDVVGRTVSKIVIGGAVPFQLYGRIVRTETHPIYGELVSVHFDSVGIGRELAARHAAASASAATGAVGPAGDEASSSRLLEYSLSGLNCSELCWLEDLNLISECITRDGDRPGKTPLPLDLRGSFSRAFTDQVEATFKLRREQYLSEGPPRQPTRVRPAEAAPGGGEAGPDQTPEGQKACTRCGTTSTPMWRKGPDGPATLCNACGVRLSRKPSFREKDLSRAAVSRKRELDALRTPGDGDDDLEAEAEAEADGDAQAALLLMAGHSPEQSGEGQQMRNMTPPDTD